MNKKLRELGLKMGDKVVATADSNSRMSGEDFFRKGDVGVVCECPGYWANPEQDIAVDFSKGGNTEVNDDGIWCVYQDDGREPLVIKPYTP